jgi:subtilisin family serine protease
MKYFTLHLILTNLLAVGVFAQGAKFDSELQEAIQRRDPLLPVIVVLDPIDLSAVAGVGNLTAGELQYIREEEVKTAQAEISRFVRSTFQNGTDADIYEFKFFWSTNALSITASEAVIRHLAQFPEVQKIIYDSTVQLTYRVDEPKPEAQYTYGLQKIGIPDLRRQYPHLTGKGVVVGILDTGIDGKHPELQGRVKAFGDFIQGKTEAYDDNGHGTHVAGTIAGSGIGGTEIGVAPEATLVIGKILSGQGGGSLSGILQGMEWITNPDRRLNSNLRPHVVNNSWGSNRFDGNIRTIPFAQHVITWVEMGIFPVFAAGNNGRAGTKTIGDPAGLPMAYAVGATDENDQVTDFSSRGPVQITDVSGRSYTLVKPDVSAPGARVYSSVPGGGYERFSGTSMAAPHLTGAIALLYQANPEITIPQVVQVLEETAVYLGDSESRKKSNDFGMGRIHLGRAVEALTSYGYYHSGW